MTPAEFDERFKEIIGLAESMDLEELQIVADEIQTEINLRKGDQ